MGYNDGQYWANRSDMLYYAATDRIVRTAGYDAKSLIDVGTGNCPYMDWWDWIPKKVSIDIRAPYSSEQVEAITANILNHKFEEKFDVCTCLQVLEHVQDAKTFARRLFEIGKTVIISVPFMWPEGRTTGHVHDPVSERKLESWVGRSANQRLIVTEPFGFLKHERLIAIYHTDPKKRFNSKSPRWLRSVGERLSEEDGE